MVSTKRLQTPAITIALDKLRHNARALCDMAVKYGVEVAGITKCTWGDPAVAGAMIAGGVHAIAESRLGNIARLKTCGITCPLWLLRLPALCEVEQVVALADVSLNSEPAVISALDTEAVRQKKQHGIILMAELGDLREGMLEKELFTTAESIASEKREFGVKLVGFGVNLSCFGGVIPSTENLGKLVQYARRAEKHLGLQLRYISGGNSSSLSLLMSGKMPVGINHLRLGESILFGQETVQRTPLEGLHQECFTLWGKIIELKQKPSLPQGEIGEDAFGTIPHFEDRGRRLRAIVNIGKADTDISGIRPRDAAIAVLGASSDHLLLDVTESKKRYSVGDSLCFSVNYAALLMAMSSPSITVQYCCDEAC